ncbi:MAG: FMN-binding negative transcriptional regulator [Planctomycetaceae bacterium]|nr:FMN-binding negative transcriptional regulator [Planctomycetaceae bacterium]
MHVPAAYSMTDSDTLRKFLQAHSFALLICNGLAGSETNEPPFAVHLPLIADPDDASCLIGHVARGNPLWKMADGKKVLAVFSGPHSYITPTWYGEQNVVPTWNYLTVHVTGTLRVVNDPVSAMEIVDHAVQYYEASSDQPWSLESTDQDFREKLISGIVAFRIHIESMQGAWKLSQHHSAERRRRTVEGLRERATGDDREIAALMEFHGPC